MNFDKKYHQLDQFLGHFHQDWISVFSWSDEKPNFQAVVRWFKIHNSAQIVEQLTSEIQTFLALSYEDNKFDEVMIKEFGFGFTPRSQGLNKKQFLEHSLEILKEPAEKTEQKFIPKFIG